MLQTIPWTTPIEPDPNGVVQPIRDGGPLRLGQPAEPIVMVIGQGVLDRPAPKLPTLPSVAPVRDQVPVPSPSSVARRSDLLSSDWGWGELRDYVVASIIERFGPILRNPVTEKSIFSSFINRWGADEAEAIARRAFEIHEGVWGSAPISVNRFCIASDPYFAEPLLEASRQACELVPA